MSSPARSSVSATSGGHGGGSSSNAAFCDDASPYHFPPELISVHDRKEEALSGTLKSELMAALQKEVKSLDEDSWMFSRPRSQINLISRPGGYAHKLTETHDGELDKGREAPPEANIAKR
ncbi:putative protein SAMBA [Dioscorea sansibarensis]